MVGAVDVAQTTLDGFHKSFQSLVISTITEKNEPYSSYAPFVNYEGEYYIIISSSAPHYDYIKANNQASIFLVEDESVANNPFFRKRLSYLASFTEVDSNEIKAAFIKKFGNMAEIVIKMDFHILRCNVEHGKLIIGPGQAFFVDKDHKISGHDNSAKHSKK